MLVMIPVHWAPAPSWATCGRPGAIRAATISSWTPKYSSSSATPSAAVHRRLRPCTVPSSCSTRPMPSPRNAQASPTCATKYVSHSPHREQCSPAGYL